MIKLYRLLVCLSIITVSQFGHANNEIIDDFKTEREKKAYFAGLVHGQNMVLLHMHDKISFSTLIQMSARQPCQSQKDKLHREMCPLIKASFYKSLETKLKNMDIMMQAEEELIFKTPRPEFVDKKYIEKFVDLTFTYKSIETLLEQEKKEDPDYKNLPKW